MRYTLTASNKEPEVIVSAERSILNGLIGNEVFSRKVLPFIDNEYFTEQQYKVLHKEIVKYIERYNGLPTYEALRVELDNNTSLNQKEYESAANLINELSVLTIDNTPSGTEWLTTQAEQFCKDRAIHNAVLKAALVLDGKDKTIERNALPDVLQQALGVSFDDSIGHDYSDAERRFEFYHSASEKLAFDIERLNQITHGGLLRKTLTILMASTGAGKTLVMTHLAGEFYRQGKNVLYITLEMGEEKIAERIDANLMRKDIQLLSAIPRDLYMKTIRRIQSQTTGRLIIKEYPPTTASVVNFRHLLNELKIKQKFVPDVIFIDYMNICASARIKMSNNTNSYGYVKAIAEEVRGIAVEFNVPIISATQTNRGGMGSTDLDLTDISDSIGLTFTADLFLAISASEEMQKLNQLVFQQLKNRYGDLNYYRKFIVGCDRAQMRLYNIEESALRDLEADLDFQPDESRPFSESPVPFNKGPATKFAAGPKTSNKPKFKLQ